MSLISVLARNRLRHENRSHFIAACCYATRPSMRRAPTQKMRAAKAPTVPEGASEAEANEIRLKVQQDHLRMIEKEAERGNQRRVNVNSVNVPLLALHLPQRVIPFLLSGQLNIARKVWFREVLEKLKDALHFWLATQHPVLPGMQKKPKLWHVFDIFSVRSLSKKRPLAGLRRHALEQYIRLNELEAKGVLNEITTFASDPLGTQMRNRVLQRGRGSVEWRFHGEIEPTRCLSFRMMPSIGVMDLSESQAGVQQVLMKFKTRQSLVLRDPRGRIIGGSHETPKVVTDYLVLEHKNWSDGLSWQPKAQMYDVPPPEAKSQKETS